MPSNHYKITGLRPPLQGINWLIGFIEGDGSFNYNPQTKKVIFSMGQKGNKVLLDPQGGFWVFTGPAYKPEARNY
jgi:hypothetical protein